MSSNLNGNPVSDGSDGPTGSTTKPRKRRFTKLKATELVGLPGATPAIARSVERDVAFIQFAFPITGSVGTAAESSEIIEFASNLNGEGKTQRIGSVSKIGFGDGSAEVVLRLDAPVDPANHGAAAAAAFNALGDFLNASHVLCVDRDGRRATWRAKINGTTIADGRY